MLSLNAVYWNIVSLDAVSFNAVSFILRTVAGTIVREFAFYEFKNSNISRVFKTRVVRGSNPGICNPRHSQLSYDECNDHTLSVGR